ncbi:MAG: MarR family transcriptional regulator [Paracoccaceae bacterium]
MLQQTPHDRIGRLIQQVGRSWRRALDQRLQPLGLTDATWLPLLYLHRVGPVKQVELADYLGLDRSSVVRLVDTLAAQGLVERRDDPSDRRVKRVQLTDQAAPLVRAARAEADGLRADVLGGIDNQALVGAERVMLDILSRLPGGEGAK